MAATKWVANVTGENWLVAKISIGKKKTKFAKIYSFQIGKEIDETTNSSAPNFEDEPEKMGLELKKVLKKNRIPSSKIALSISCPGVITRIVTVPVMKKKLLDQLFSEQLQQYFTFNVADYLIDYRVLQEVEEDGQKRLRILLAAVPKDIWNNQYQMLKTAKVKPNAVDIQFECLARVYSHLGASDIAILNLSGDRAEIILLEKGVFFLYSDLPIDTQAFDLLANSEESNHRPEEESGENALAQQNYLEDLENVLFPVMRNLSDLLNFFSARHFGKNVDVIYLSGEYASLKEIDKVFFTNLEIDTKVGYPEGWQLHFAKKVSGYREHAGKLAGLIGLALRED